MVDRKAICVHRPGLSPVPSARYGARFAQVPTCASRAPRCAAFRPLCLVAPSGYPSSSSPSGSSERRKASHETSRLPI
ncbi:hypothetical protein C2E23DRAFT_798957 [Lenzites betulinus]|nr:hypothetical protein C2E23DRAFT_798957 [Lenzites betulinus]